MQIKQIFSDNHLVIQEGQSNCGPAALLNVLHLKGDFSHNEEELAQLCEAKLGYGTTPENLIKAAQQLGLEVVEEKSNSSLEDIQRNIDSGAYVIILSAATFSGNSHYTCITEYDDGALYCRDSAYGLLRLSTEYLDDLWHGVDHDASRGSQQWYMAVK
jgi:ABC-type bacteriocin/lantibiotic exporter with double-glycine peptidase domain